ncbi:hypothetical protein ACB094_09G033700 [Castanea mollissima]
MGKGKGKPPVFFLRGKKRPVNDKGLYPCEHCNIEIQGKSERDEHQNKCRMKVCIFGQRNSVCSIGHMKYNFLMVKVKFLLIYHTKLKGGFGAQGLPWPPSIHSLLVCLLL